MKTYTSSLENSVPHWLYDLSLPLAERREKRVLFRTAKDVALFVGIMYSSVTHFRKPGNRVQGKDGKLYAIRLATEKDLEEYRKKK